MRSALRQAAVTLLLLGHLVGGAWAQAPDPLEQGRQAYRDGEYTQAVEFLLVALRSGASPELYYYLGLAYYSLNTYSLAIDAFETALELYQSEAPPVDLLFSLAISYYYAGQLEQSQEALNTLLNDVRTPPELRAQAEQQLLLSLRDQSSAYQDAVLAYQEGRYAEARTGFEQALQIIPDSPEILYYLGITAYQLLDFAAARSYLERVVALEPNGDYGASAQQTLDVVKNLEQNLPARPFSGSLSLGTLGDSNVNFGDAGNNRIDLIEVEPALQDLASTFNLNLNYSFNAVSSLRYNYLLSLYWGLNDGPERALNSYDYNLQQHALSLFHRLPLLDWLELYLDTHTSLQVLAGEPFFAEGGVRPTLTFYESERLITRGFLDVSTERYNLFQERDNWNYSLGLDQFIYLWNSRSWLRFGYRFNHVLARDNLRSQFQESNGAILETEFLAANSRSQNQLGLGFHFPVGPLDLEVGTLLDFLNYNNPDIYRSYTININPITGLPLPRVENPGSVVKHREDSRLTFFVNLEWPIAEHWRLLGRYQRLTNVSNISPLEIPTLTSRSYLKDVLELNLRWEF
ncbi:MAG: tetratricopeptide repeat protein [Candidatus Sericytochromatia bacterium]